MGWFVLVVGGAVLWWWSIALTLQAYRGERMPLWANPRKAPRRAIALRALGAAAVVFGTGMAAQAWTGPAGIVAPSAAAMVGILLLAPYVVAVARHNRGLPAPS